MMPGHEDAFMKHYFTRFIRSEIFRALPLPTSTLSTYEVHHLLDKLTVTDAEKWDNIVLDEDKILWFLDITIGEYEKMSNAKNAYQNISTSNSTSNRCFTGNIYQNYDSEGTTYSLKITWWDCSVWFMKTAKTTNGTVTSAPGAYLKTAIFGHPRTATTT